jgi:hypothetical protein
MQELYLFVFSYPQAAFSVLKPCQCSRSRYSFLPGCSPNILVSWRRKLWELVASLKTLVLVIIPDYCWGLHECFRGGWTVMNATTLDLNSDMEGRGR